MNYIQTRNCLDFYWALAIIPLSRFRLERSQYIFAVIKAYFGYFLLFINDNDISLCKNNITR